MTNLRISYLELHRWNRNTISNVHVEDVEHR